MSDSTDHRHERDVSLWEEHSATGFTIFFFVLGLFAVLGSFPYMAHREPEVAGQFGDSFGFINAFFSAFAIAGLLVTIVIQIKEFRLAQQERRDALDTQKEIGEQHARNLEIQKQIAESYTKNIEVQKQMSDQQLLNSVVTSISTWAQLVGEVAPPPHEQMTVEYLKFLRQRKLNAILLRIAQNQTLGGDGLLAAGASLRDHPDYVEAGIETYAAVVFAEYILGLCKALSLEKNVEREELFSSYRAKLEKFRADADSSYRRMIDDVDWITATYIRSLYKSIEEVASELSEAIQHLDVKGENVLGVHQAISNRTDHIYRMTSIRMTGALTPEH